MRLLAPLASVAALAALIGLSLSTAAAPARAASETYTVDGAHSFVWFRIKHMDMSYAYGRFNDFKGSLTWDEANPAGATISVEVKSASVDTGITKRDDHLRSPDFFNAAQFPTITFQSTAAKSVDATHLEVTGNLTLHGKTKSVTFPVERVGSGKSMMDDVRAGFEATLTVKRSDFDLGKPGGVSDEVRLTISLETVKG